MTDEMLVALVQAKIVAGTLPHSRPDVVWAGYGTNRPCSACARPISSQETEWEIDVPGTPTCHFHDRCLNVWESEVTARGRISGGTPVDDAWIFDHGVGRWLHAAALEKLLVSSADARRHAEWARSRAVALSVRAAALRENARQMAQRSQLLLSALA